MKGRRRFLGAAGALLLVRDVLAAGKLEKGVYRVAGDARINGAPARPGREVKTGDVVTTGASSQIIFVVNRDAFLVRSHARLEVGGAAADVFRVVTGALLSVFQPGQRKTLRTANATIGIRGTGIYVESAPERTYVCTCYGVAEIVPDADPSHAETVRTRHHEQPRYVMARGAPQMMMKAPVVNHTDKELELLESLVGRTPPFDPFERAY
ncbi:MAG TPA: hypothetical protein VFV84_04320 [Burkholderiales bacterium]|nr:hypothetical protein [Burkholderiales bacterium]